MANTRALVYGHDKSRTKVASRLGSVAAEAHADTWRTFTVAFVNADGSGFVDVKRDGRVIHLFRFGPESEV